MSGAPEPAMLPFGDSTPVPPSRHRLSLLIGSGLVGGVALITLPPKHWARVGAALFGCGAWLARSPIGLALVVNLWNKIPRDSIATRRPEVAEAGSSPPVA
jgi:hypothetical protein